MECRTASCGLDFRCVCGAPTVAGSQCDEAVVSLATPKPLPVDCVHVAPSAYPHIALPVQSGAIALVQVQVELHHVASLGTIALFFNAI